MRDALGLDPFDNAAADRPMVLTATGYVPIETNAGAEGASASKEGANGQGANAQTPAAKLALLKASTDDPEHPGWPAGTPGGRGGKFRPKDDEGINTSSNSAAAEHASRPNTNYAALHTDTLTDVSTGESQHETMDDPAGNSPDRYAQVDIPKFDETGNPLIDHTTRILFETLLRVHLLVGDGAGPLYGIRVHTLFAYDLKAQNLPGIDGDGVEQSFVLGDIVYYGLDGSVRTDVILRGPDRKIIAVWDVKTGSAQLSGPRVKQIQAQLKLSPDVPIYELHVSRGITKKN
jgi:hypothetical protein